MSVLSRLFQRDRPPPDALTPLSPDERVVAWATTADQAAVIATPRGLWLPTPGGRPERISWHLVDKAVWRDGALTVTPAVDTGAGVLDELPPRTVRLAVPRNLPETVRTRVENSIAFSRHYPLTSAGEMPAGGVPAGGVPTGGTRAGGVRVVGRRVPGRDGLTWQAVFDPGTDRDDPLVRAYVARLIQQATADLTA